MRIMFLFFAVFVFLFRLTAQDSSTVRVFSRYNLGSPKVVQPGPFFIARHVQPLAAGEMETLLLNTTRAIRQQTLSGKRIVNYSIHDAIRPGFPDFYSISDAEMLRPDDFRGNHLRLYEAYDRGRRIPYICFEALKDSKVAVPGCTIDEDGRLIIRTDTVLTEDKKRGRYVERPVHLYLEPGNAALFFGEEWAFDFVKGTFEKQVRFTGFGQPKCDDRETYCFVAPLFAVENKTDTTKSNWKLFRKNHITDVALDYANSVMEFRYMDTKIDVSDISGMQSIPDGTISPDYRLPFLAAVFNYAIKNPAHVFPVTDAGVVDSLNPFKTAMQVKNLFTWSDTVQLEDPMNPGELILAPLKHEFLLTDIYALRFYEDWYINEKTGYVRKKVHGISFLVKSADTMGVPLLRNAGIYLQTR